MKREHSRWQTVAVYVFSLLWAAMAAPLAVGIYLTVPDPQTKTLARNCLWASLVGLVFWALVVVFVLPAVGWRRA